MGMYTAFRLQCRIRKEYEPALSLLLGGQTKVTTKRTDWKTVATKYPEFEPYSKISRCDFIPFGAGGFLGGYWGDESYCKLVLTPGNRMWLDTVCTLKDYDNTIEAFCQMVLPLISDEVTTLESWYEEDKKPRDLLKLQKRK